MIMVNINRCTAEELQKIKHIGPKRADRIIERRPFKDIYELSNVLGLGKSRMRDILEQEVITT